MSHYKNDCGKNEKESENCQFCGRESGERVEKRTKLKNVCIRQIRLWVFLSLIRVRMHSSLYTYIKITDVEQSTHTRKHCE